MTHLYRHSGEGRNPFGFSAANIGKLFFAFVGALSVLWIPAFAGMTGAYAADEVVAEEAAPAGLYAPDFCDFEITFPEKPALSQKCLPDGRTCYDLQSYTMVYDMSTTVDVSATCRKSTPADYKRYTETVMRAALAGMVDQRRVGEHTIRVEEKDGVRTASLAGTGITGAREKIYTAQLWVGQNSVFTVQAELIGSEHADADSTFSDILKSVQVKKKAPAAH